MMRSWEKYALFGVIASWSIIVPAQRYWPAIEGHFWPVVSVASVYDPSPSPPPGYRYTWSGDASKLRDCAFIRLEWFMGSRGGPYVGVPAEFLDAPQLRSKGEMHWDEIAVSLSPDNVGTNSYAYVYHDCGWPWEVRSLFYDSTLNL